MKKNILVIILLLILSIPAVKSLIPKGGYTSHDLTHHVVRQIDMNKLLSEGQFPPRWSGDLNNGYGYPLYLFIYPTPPIMGEAFLKTGFDPVESVKAVMFVSLIISVIGMYLFLDSLFPGKKPAAFLGALFYLYTPVRFLNVYVSAAVGNAVALGFLPFIFWTIVKASQNKKWAIPVGAIFILLLVTSHNVTTLMFAPVFIIFAAILFFKSKERKNVLKNLLLMAGLGLGLSAFFWIPALTEKKYIIYDQVLGKFWTEQFPLFRQLIRSPWGYGLSHPGVDEPGGLSFEVGVAQWFVMGVLTISLPVWRKKKEFLLWGSACLIIFLITIFIELKPSTFIWDHLPLIYLVQFPARFSAVAEFVAAIAASLLIIYLPFKKIVFFFLLVLVLYASRNHLNVNEAYNPGMDYYYNRLETTASSNEHLPIWGYAPSKVSSGKLQILSGGGQIIINENKSAKVIAQINLNKDSKIRFNQFYFPGWILKINGKEINFDYKEKSESQGLPVFSLYKGNYSFEADFKDTTDRKIADMISIISLTALGIFLIFIKLKRA